MKADRFNISDNQTLFYFHGTSFPEIGRIADKSEKAISANDARHAIEATFEYQYGPIIHLDLSGKVHNIVKKITKEPHRHQTYIADAAIVQNNWSVAIETFLGDCTCNIIVGPNHTGFIHAGRPELFDGIIDAFFKQWPDPLDQTSAFVGPGLCGKHYEMPDASRIQGTNLMQFICQTTSETQGFDVTQAIIFQLKQYLSNRIISANICPYCEIEKGNTQWASATYYQKNSNEKSPRDCALFYTSNNH